MWRRNLRWAILAAATCAPSTMRVEAQEAPALPGAESLIKDLRAEDVDVRRAAANALVPSGRDAQRRALPVLIDLLMKEKDGQVRLAVLDAVTALGPDAAPAVPALVHTLRTNYGGQGKEELHQDYRSALALAAVGKPAVEGLRGLLEERKENVRAEVVMGLGRIGPDAAEAVPDLLPLLGDRSERICREATLALGRIGNAAAGPLVAASEDGEASLRARAVESLGHLTAPDERVRKAVLEHARDEAPEVRAAALRSLARFTVPDDALATIVEASLRDQVEAVRLAAVDLLVSRRALLSRLATALQSLVEGEHDGPARHAAFLLGKAGPEAAPRLLEALRHEKARVDQVAEALAQVGRPAVGPISRALGDPDPRVRRGAALALGQIRPMAPGTVPKLTAGLADPDPDAKEAFLTAIGYLGRRAGESVPAVRTMLKDRTAEIRLKAIDILAQTAPRDERLLGDLTGLLDDADVRVQRQTIDLVRTLGPPGRKALPVVIAKLDSPDPDVRLAAAEFIGSHGQAAAEAVPSLSALLADPSPKLRTVAAQTLGKLGKAAQPAFDRLTPLLGAEQFEVREAATSALGSLELDAAVIRPHLAKALVDDRPEVRRAATRAIQRLGPEGAIFLPDVIVSVGTKETSRSAGRALRPFERGGPDPRTLPELVKLLEHDREAVRLLAIRFLALAGDAGRDAIPALERLRNDPSAEVRRQAESAGEKLKSGAATARARNAGEAGPRP